VGHWVTINGNRVFIEDGEPPKKKSPAGAVVAGAVLAGLMAAAGGAGATGSVGAALDSASAQAAERSADTDTGQRKEEAAHETDAWTKIGVKMLRQAIKERFECAAQSTGPGRGVHRLGAHAHR
jgi:hypothetical protein